MTGVSPNLSASAPPIFLPAAETALAGLTLATVAGFTRVFDNPSFAPPLVAIAVFSHLALALCRRRGWGVITAAAVSLSGATLVGIWLVFPSTTFAGVPTGETVDATVTAVQTSWRQFGTILAPAPTEPGFVVASCIALFFAVFLADWAAFRLWSSFEAAVPASTLFAFCSLLGADHKIVSAAVYLAALLLFLLLHRVARQESSSGWLVTDAGRSVGSRGAPVLTGAVLAAMAVLAGSLIGPRMPGADSEALWPWRSGAQSPGERKAVSPLVNIRNRLLNQPDLPLFTVRSSKPAYWRLTSLETFDGEIWRSSARFGDAEGDLPGEVTEGEIDLLDQRFNIENLSMIWAPAAYRPVRVVESRVPLTYNEDSSTLIVASNAPLEGSTYTIQSKYTKPTIDQLRSVTSDEVPEDIRARYGGLPSGFSDLARETALQQTQGRNRPYDKARALQDFFRSEGGFQYDTAFEGGHSDSAIDAFLRQRRGFCEQFAGTFAAMARAVGLPSRVAVGFTHGVIKSPNVPNVYQVTARQTHAWPEVYLGRFGWVMFEPTPGRGAPNASWTEVQPQQDTGARSAPTSAPTTLGTVAPSSPSGMDPAPPTSAEPETTTTLPSTADKPTETQREWYWQWLLVVAPILAGVAVVLLGVAALAALYASALRYLVERRRAERRARATDASRRVVVAWQECLEALQPLGLVPSRAESNDEFARRVAPRLGDAGPELVAMASVVDHANYAGDLVDEQAADTATNAAGSIIGTVDLQITPMQRWLQRFDPRILLQDSRREPQHTISM